MTAGSSLAAKVKMARMKRLASPYLHKATKDPPYHCNVLHNQSMTMTHDAQSCILSVWQATAGSCQSSERQPLGECGWNKKPPLLMPHDLQAADFHHMTCHGVGPCVTISPFKSLGACSKPSDCKLLTLSFTASSHSVTAHATSKNDIPQLTVAAGANHRARPHKAVSS